MDTSMIQYKQGIPFVPVTFPINDADGILIEDLQLHQLVDHINCHDIRSAYVCNINNYDFLNDCLGVEHIAIELKVLPQYYSSLEKRGTKLIKQYNIAPLYKLNRLKSLSIIDIEVPFISSNLKIDLNKFSNLEKYSGKKKYIDNLGNAKSLKSLDVIGYDKDTLSDLSKLQELDTFVLTSSKINSLKGCEHLQNLQCLYLYNNRALNDISALSAVKNSLKALRIENCSKISDFSAIEELEELELLELSGSNEIPSISFIKKMKNLKTFIFSINVLDGDLTPCLDLQYVYCDKVRKHYNLKDGNLPKGRFMRGNEDIEEWRRFE